MSNEAPNQQQPAENQVSMTNLMAYHEQTSGEMAEDDMLAVAGLFNRVGSELLTVDKHSVGGNSNIKALKLDKNEMLRGMGKLKQQAPVSQPQQAPVSQSQQAPVVKNSQPPATHLPNDILKRIEDMESKIKSLDSSLVS